MRNVWSGMKKITGFKQRKDCIDGSFDRANELNAFFNRFTSGTSSASSCPVSSQRETPLSSDPHLWSYHVLSSNRHLISLRDQ